MISFSSFPTAWVAMKTSGVPVALVKPEAARRVSTAEWIRSSPSGFGDLVPSAHAYVLYFAKGADGSKSVLTFCAKADIGVRTSTASARVPLNHFMYPSPLSAGGQQSQCVSVYRTNL